jgi:hypothetical protein
LEDPGSETSLKNGADPYIALPYFSHIIKLPYMEIRVPSTHTS